MNSTRKTETPKSKVLYIITITVVTQSRIIAIFFANPISTFLLQPQHLFQFWLRCLGRRHLAILRLSNKSARFSRRRQAKHLGGYTPSPYASTTTTTTRANLKLRTLLLDARLTPTPTPTDCKTQKIL
eukprot:GHVT01035623.1.p1 GENE.GHVT01035623.1~~GHVT01035623.1.p1  ORF type:complete len:128 (+),score=18.83 GHVT01035623.1:33-416(+)